MNSELLGVQQCVCPPANSRLQRTVMDEVTSYEGHHVAAVPGR